MSTLKTRIEIKKVNREEEQHLVGKTSVLTHPFPYFDVEYVGVYLDQPDQYTSRIFVISPLMMILNTSSNKMIS